MVCESDMLLHHQDLFKLLSNGGFSIVLPDAGTQ